MKRKPIGEAPLLIPTISLMLGIVVGQYVKTQIPLLLVFASVVVVTLFLYRYERLRSVGIAACFVVLGWLLVNGQKAGLKVQWPDSELVFDAVVVTDPVEKPKTMAVDIILVSSGQKLKCYLYKDDRSRGLKIGDGLRIQSRISENSDWHIGTFNYRKYLETQGFTGRTFVSNWNWQKVQISLENISRLQRTKLFFLKLRSRLLKRISSQMVVHDSQINDSYAVVAAMALGDKSALTKELKDAYSITGASHILALSGLHLSIIYSLLMLLFGRKPLTYYLTFITILCIWAYAFLVGLSTSVIRSAVMISMFALMSLGHRDKMSVNMLAFTAIVLLIINPMSLFDVGFQMSFMAVLSILIFYPLFESVFSQEYLLSHKIVRWVWGMVSVSCAAQIGVAPLIAYYFGRFSTWFILTNFIVIPAATLILYLSLLVLFVPAFAYILLYIVGILNSVLTKMTALPCAYFDGLHPTLVQVTMIYVIILSVYLLLLRLRR